MILSTEIEIKLGSHNMRHYESKGYDLKSLRIKKNKKWSIPNGTRIKVKIEDLVESCPEKVFIKCDYCDKEYWKKYCLVITHRKNIKKDCCNNVECMKKKRNEANEFLYGVKNQFQREYVKEKSKETMLERFGVEYPGQSMEVLEKKREGYMERFGVTNNSQTQDWIEKVKTTSLERFGVEFPFQSEEFKEKSRRTCQERYGDPIPMRNPEIKSKALDTMRKNGSAPCSSQQAYIHSVIGGELNYREGNCLIDIAFPDEKIAVEYNGGGHDLQVKYKTLSKEEFDKKEMRRKYFLHRRGWKIITFISPKDNLFSEEIIKEIYSVCKSYLDIGRHWVEVDFENWTIIGSIINYKFKKSV